MRVTEKTIENCQAILTIELDSEDMKLALENAYRKLVKRTEVPGFRKGKTPRPILERYLGKDRIIEESFDEVLPKACSEAIKEQDIKAFGTPGVEVLQNDPVIFKAKVPLPPNIELGAYKDIRLVPEPVEVKEDVLDGMIKQLKHEKATWEPVDRPVVNGNLVVMNLQSSIDDVPFINQESAQFGINVESGYPAPGFSAEIIGLNIDDEKEFILKYPDDFAKAELAGKEPKFKIRITEIKEEKLPAEDDDFAKSLGVGIETFSELKDRMAENYRQQLEKRAEEKYESQLIDELVGISKAEFPSNLVDMEYERLVNQQLDQWQQQVGSEAEYQELLGRMDPQALADKLRPAAEERVRKSLILGKLSTEEELEISEDDIEKEIDLIIQSFPEEHREEQKARFKNQEAREDLSQVLLTRKTLQRLKDIAQGKYADDLQLEKASQKKDDILPNSIENHELDNKKEDSNNG